MKRRNRSAGRILPWILVAGVSIAALGGPIGVDAEEDVMGGRLSRACRAGLWLMSHGRSLSGAALMWFGC